MKHYLLAVVTFICSVIALAQAPNKMSFQTVVRNNLGKLVVNKSIGVRLSILKASSTATAVYEETHTKTSNVNGLVILEVGNGTTISGVFSTIDWAQGPYFLKTEIDVEGGANYTISGVTEFESVPYAFSVKTLSNGSNVGDMNYWNGTTWVPLNAGTEGQTLTFCGGKPTWTIGGVCPGIIANLSCNSVVNNGTLNVNVTTTGVSSVISYTGGNTGPHTGQVVTSTGVIGLTATLLVGNFANGAGILTYNITGVPTTTGIASFALNIGGQSCNLTRIVDSVTQQPTSGYGPNITDIDGNTYKTVYIGTQQWMAENLKTTKYNDGTTILNITDNTQWQNNTTGAWSYYNNDSTNNSKYGKLYNWYSVSRTNNGNKNVCPSGWHVPTEPEWVILTGYLGGTSIAGGKMKEVGTTNWYSPNTDANNTSLLNCLPGGSRLDGGSFNLIRNQGFWWTSMEDYANDAWYLYLKYSGGSAYSFATNKGSGFSIRCLKD